MCFKIHPDDSMMTLHGFVLTESPSLLFYSCYVICKVWLAVTESTQSNEWHKEELTEDANLEK